MRKEIKEFIQDPTFGKLYSRNATLFTMLFFNHYAMKQVFRLFKVHIKSLMVDRAGFMDSYWLEKDLKKIRPRIVGRINKSRSIKEYYEKEALPVLSKYFNVTKKFEIKYSQTGGNWEQLLSDYKRFCSLQGVTQAYLWLIFLTDMVLDDYLEQMLRDSKELLSVSKEDFLEIISSPLQKTAVYKERVKFLKLAIRYYQKNDITRQLQKHQEEWRWFPCYNPSDKPLGMEHFVRELKLLKLKTAKAELGRILKEERAHHNRYFNIRRRLKNPRLVKLMDFVNGIAYFREYRNDVRRQGLCQTRPLFEAIGRKLSLTVKDVCYMMPEEVELSLQQKRLVMARNRLKARQVHCGLFSDKKSKLLIEDESELRKIEKLVVTKVAKKLQISGISASKGFVSGKVTIIDDIDKLKTFKKGRILVVSMTAPDYVPAMRKAKAVVTDEGGITSHAAIVSRELGVPCIVGTKIATKVFKDGDLIEVDANKGIVRKII